MNLIKSAVGCAEGAQALVLMTEWPEIVEADWEAIARSTRQPRFLFDGRNALDGGRMRDLGFDYIGVGRGAIAQRRSSTQRTEPWKVN